MSFSPPGQLRVSDELSELSLQLETCEPRPAATTTGAQFLSMVKLLAGRNNASGPISSPKGLYIWGTVGGGKTMLMDMFFDTLVAGTSASAALARRTHFHDFMQEVHALIHETKKLAPPRDMHRWEKSQPFDPIPPVGSVILGRSRVLCLDEFQVRDATSGENRAHVQ